MKKNISTIIFTLTVSICLAQNKTASYYIEKANNFFDNKNFKESDNYRKM